jgi:tetratricopeptide (TPR) repeat protein
MTAACLSIPLENSLIEPFEDRVDILYHELELATMWQRPSVLLAIYSSDCVRADADTALENRLHKLGQSAYHIRIKSQKNTDVSLLISELADLSNVVFFVEGLRWGAGADDRSTYRILNKSREFFIENQVRVVFWLTEDEAIDLAHFAPDYWSFRHRVIEFVDSPKPGPAAPPILEPAWQGRAEARPDSEDLDAKIALREALLTDLPEGNESTSARANLLLTLGMLHWRRADLEQASRFLNTALDLGSGLEDAGFEALCFNAIALVETDLGRPEQAVRAYQNAIKLAPGKISAWNNLGKLYRKLGRNEEALAAFQKAVEQNDSDALGWNGLGELYHLLGRNDDAVYAFLKAIEISPTYAPSWSGLGNSYLAEGQLDEALAAHLKAIETDHHSLDSRFALGDIYKLQGKSEDASLAYRTVIELDSNNGQAWNRLGDLHFGSDASEEALFAYQKALDSDQGCSLSYSNLASIYIQKGRHAEAIPLLQKAIELRQDAADKVCLWNRLGDTYRRLNDYGHAITAYRSADELNSPSDCAPTAPPCARADPHDSPSEDIFDQPASNFKLRSMQEQALPTWPAESADLRPPEEPPALAESAPIPAGPEAEFFSWLDGLAAVMTDLQQHQAGPSAAENLAEVEETLKIQFVQPEVDYPVYTKAEPTRTIEEDSASWYEPLPEFTESQALPDPLMSAMDGPDEPASQAGAATGEDTANLWNELGSIYLNTGAYPEAINAFKKAIELDRSYGWSYNNLAALYSHQGRYKDAIPLYQEGLRYLGEPRDKALLWNRLGDAYRRLDEHDRAAAAYQKAMQLDPDNVSILTRARFSLLGNCRA